MKINKLGLKINKLGQYIETLDIESAKDMHQNLHLSLAEISKRLGVTKAAVSYAFKRHNVSVLTTSLPKIKISTEEIIKRVESGEAMTVIAREQGVSEAAIRKRLVGVNIIRPIKQKKEIISEPDIEYQISNGEWAIISGIFLGDGHISKEYEYMNPHIEYGHAADQGDYVRLIHHFLKNLMGNRPITTKAPSKNVNEDTFFRFKTCQNKELAQIREKNYQEGFFPNGNALKRITQDILDHMDASSLAIFYMDDGFNNNWNDMARVGFCTDNFHIDDVKLLASHLLNRFGIDTYILSKNSILTTGHQLIIHDHSLEKFEYTILPYIIKCHRSKFPCQYVIPPWEDDPNYESEWDKIMLTLSPLPEPRINTLFVSKYSNIRQVQVGSGESVSYAISHTSRIDVGDFLDDHHYLGRPPHHAKYYFKLEKDGKMVGAMAFSTLRAQSICNKMFKVPVDLGRV